MVAYWVLGGLVLAVVLSLVKPFQKRVSLVGKNVIVTGGSEGIGRDLTLMIAKENIKSITVIARTQSKLDKIATELRKTCSNVLTISCDVTKNDSVAKAIDESEAQFGAPDVLITCAGLATPGYFLEQDVSVTEHTMQVDFFGTLYATHRAAHHMAKKGSGNIIMVGSTLSALGLVGYSSYCPAKYAVTGLAETLRSELSPYNIRVAVAYPPDTQTPGYDRENQTKPPDTKEISAMSTVYKSEDVASYILAGIKGGDFHIVMEPFAKIFVSLSNSISPRQYGLLEGLLSPVIALIGFVTRVLNDYIVNKHYKLRKDKKD